MNSQTKMYLDTFNISHIISQFIHYSLENGNRIWQEFRVKLSEKIHLDNVSVHWAIFMYKPNSGNVGTIF